MLLNYVNVIVSGERQFLEIKPLEYVQEYWPNASITSTPRYFANFNDTTLYVAPTPDAEYTIELGYQGRINPYQILILLIGIQKMLQMLYYMDH